MNKEDIQNRVHDKDKYKVNFVECAILFLVLWRCQVVLTSFVVSFLHVHQMPLEII